jgi:uncharacterized membrane protein YccC
MDLSTIVGIVMAVAGAIWAAVQWAGKKAGPVADSAIDLVQDAVRKLQGDPSAPSTMTRMQALEHIEALSRFLEKKPSSEDTIKALQTVLLSVFQIPKSKE